MEYFKHGKFYENILEIIVIKPLTKILDRNSFCHGEGSSGSESNFKNLKLSRFAHDLANSDLDTISDVANAALEVFTPWNGGIPELISKFKIYCRKQSTSILSNWILNCGDEALNLLDSSTAKDEKPVYNIAWGEIFNLINRNVEEVVKYYPTGSGSGLKTSSAAKKAFEQPYRAGSYVHGHSSHNSEPSNPHTGSSIHSNDTSLPGNMNRLFTERVDVLPKIFNVNEKDLESLASENQHYLPDSNFIILTLLKYIVKGAIETGRLVSQVNLHQTQFDIFCVKDFIRKKFSRKDIFEDNGLKQLLDDWLNSCMVRSEDPSLLEDSALEFLLHRNQ